MQLIYSFLFGIILKTGITVKVRFVSKSRQCFQFGICSKSGKPGWHGNASTRKRMKHYFWGISVFLRNSRKSLKSSELLRGIQIFCIRFPIFIVEWFPLFFDQFPHIFRSVSSFYWSVSTFFKNFKILILLIGFLKF